MDSPSALLPFCLAGIAAGLILLWRGFGGYRTAVTIGDTATSRIDSLAAGEVRITGTIEAGEATLVSPLQSVSCVWYRAEVRSRDHDSTEVFAEERAVGFRVRDADGGRIRVFPAGARIGVSPRFDEGTGLMGDAPVGLNLRTGSAYGPGAGTGDEAIDRETAIAALLTVRAPTAWGPGAGAAGDVPGHGAAAEYEESRLEPGDVVTIVGMALPFGHLPDPFGADRMDRAGDPLAGLDDPMVAAEVADARAAGTLLTPEEAWGNAAIEGFGIGRPVRAPELDPGVVAPVLATREEAARTERTFDLEPDLLVLAAGPGEPLAIGIGTPGEAVAREQGRFLLGLLGAVLAIGSAIVGAVALSSSR